MWILALCSRPVVSKGIWRDLGVLHHLEPVLTERGETAVYFMLGTLAGQRRRADVRQMERVYGWPVAHERGYPDLSCGEEIVGDMVDDFNRNHETIRAVLVNQWDWNRHVCGGRMPEDMTFADIRHGVDVEFGLSVYEPFGISQLEALSFGAVCVVSNVCGCLGFARRARGHTDLAQNIVEADFLAIEDKLSLEELRSLSMERRDKIESAEARRLARVIAGLLVQDDSVVRRRIESGYALAEKMSWDHVMTDYFLPGLQRAASKG